MNADELEARPAETPMADVPVTKPALGSPGKNSVVGEPGGSSSGLARLSLLLAAVALALAGWAWWQGEGDRRQQQAAWQTRQQHYLDELKRLEASLAAAQDSSLAQSTELNTGLQQRLQRLEATQETGEKFRAEYSAWNRSAQAALEDSQARLNSLEEKLRSLAALAGQSDTQLELEEIDYLLRMAQERLQLFGDARSADRALQLADQQVQAFDNPIFIGLRRDIAAARLALAAVDIPDMVTLGAEFDGLQDQLALLPFRTAVTGAAVGQDDAVAATDRPWWERLKTTLASLVTVRRVDEAELAMPAMADQQALRQRSWLLVEQARLAALNREQDVYQESLAQAQATIDRWFDAEDPQVKQAMSGLQALQQRNVDPPMPDISAPWITLHSLMETGLSAISQASAPASGTSSASTPESAAEAGADSSDDAVTSGAQSDSESESESEPESGLLEEATPDNPPEAGTESNPDSAET